MANVVVDSVSSVLQALLPLACPCCAASTQGPCAPCVETWQPARPLNTPIGIFECRALFDYGDGVESVVLAMKRTRRHGLARWMAKQMAPVAASMVTPDVITWAPTTIERSRTRGFDHGEELARALARELGVAALPVLRRTSESVSNASSAQRSLVSFELTQRGRRVVREVSQILIVDDVRTTGSTLSAAARAVCSSGDTCAVSAITFASTPVRRS